MFAQEHKLPTDTGDDREKIHSRLLSQSGEISPRAVVLYMVLFSVLACIVEIINRRFLYFGSDGLFWQVVQSYYLRYGAWYSLQNSDPLQGMFDIFPQGYRGALIPYALSVLPLDVHMNAALIHGAYAACGVVAIYVLARGAGTRRRTALLAGMLSSALTLPGLLDPDGLINHGYAISPFYYYTSSVVMLVVGLYWRISGRLNAKFFLSALLAFLVTAEVCNMLALHMVAFAPGVAVFGLGALIASDSRHEVYAKLGWAAMVLTGLICIGMPAYMFGLGSNIAANIFYNELNDFATHAIPTAANLRDDVLHVLEVRPGVSRAIPAVISATALVTAGVVTLCGPSRRFRIFSGCFLVLAFGTALTVFVCHFWFYLTGYDYKGLNPYKAVDFLWPLNFIFLAVCIEMIAMLVRAAVTRHRQSRVGAFASHHVLATAAALPLLGIVVLRGAPYFDLTPRPNEITEYLTSHNAVTLGGVYRGVVATFIATHDRESVNMADLYAGVWFKLELLDHNDLSSYGLWAYNIPTLVHNTGTMTAQYYLMLSELLARPADRQLRSFANITVPNEKILKLWGVRFVVADYVLPFGVQRISVPVEGMTEWRSEWYLQHSPSRPQDVSFDSPVRLFELARANLGDYSPTRVVEVGTAKEVVDHMRAPDFDGTSTVIATEKLRGNFVPARSALMIVERGGLSVRASSAGESLLVLPTQYSHCWRLSDARNAELFRANLMQLGIRFSGELNAQLRQVFGPLWHSHCRVEDGADMTRLKIVEARGG
jgi:hypothetical protein